MKQRNVVYLLSLNKKFNFKNFGMDWHYNLENEIK